MALGTVKPVVPTEAAAEIRQGRLALRPCPGPVLATQLVNIDSVAQKWKAEKTVLTHPRVEVQQALIRQDAFIQCVGLSLTNKLFSDGQSLQQEEGGFLPIHSCVPPLTHGSFLNEWIHTFLKHPRKRLEGNTLKHALWRSLEMVKLPII